MATLVMTEGTEPGRKFALAQEVTSFGREDTCTFQILDDKVSRTHLQVARRGDRHVAADYRSANGVFVNDTPVIAPVPLSAGDRIRIGDTTLVYHADDPGDTTSRPDGSAAKSRGQWAEETIPRPR